VKFLIGFDQISYELLHARVESSIKIKWNYGPRTVLVRIY